MIKIVKNIISGILVSILVIVSVVNCCSEAIPVNELTNDYIQYIKKENNKAILFGMAGLFSGLIGLKPMFTDDEFSDYSYDILLWTGIAALGYTVVDKMINKTSILGDLKYNDKKGYSLIKYSSKARKQRSGGAICLLGGYTLYHYLNEGDNYAENDKLLMVSGGTISVLCGIYLIIDALKPEKYSGKKNDASLVIFPGYNGIMITKRF